MFITVFVTTDSEQDQWRAELLESSWAAAGQAGELVRLVACSSDATLPMHSIARVVRTTSYCPHPYIQDHFNGYNQPAALMEWLFSEKVDATLLLLDLETLMLEPLSDELASGEAIANSWRNWPKGKGLFDLANHFNSLQSFFVNPKLKTPKVQFPVVIHSHDLKKMVARWLELTALIRCEVDSPSGKIREAHQVAYVIAAAEYQISHNSRKLTVVPDDRKVDRPFLDYRPAIESAKGKIVWDVETYTPWTTFDATKAKAGVGRSFLKKLADYVAMRESGEHLRLRRARRCPGVREGSLPDRLVLEIPGVEELVNLNDSAAIIWHLCDDDRTLSDIVDILENEFSVPRAQLCQDIDMAITSLRSCGAIDLEILDDE